MKYSELQDEVHIMVQDPGEEYEEKIPEYINHAIKKVALDIHIPDLQKVTTVNTVLNQAYLSMASDFNGRLQFVGTSDGPISVIAGGLQALLSEYPLLDKAGDVIMVTLEGTTLWYQGIPSAVTSLVVLYQESPELLVDSDDEITYIPEPMHRGLLANKAAEMLFDLIEDDMPFSERPNARAYEYQYGLERITYKQWLTKNRVNLSTSVWSV